MKPLLFKIIVCTVIAFILLLFFVSMGQEIISNPIFEKIKFYISDSWDNNTLKTYETSKGDYFNLSTCSSEELIKALKNDSFLDESTEFLVIENDALFELSPTYLSEDELNNLCHFKLIK